MSRQKYYRHVTRDLFNCAYLEEFFQCGRQRNQGAQIFLREVWAGIRWGVSLARYLDDSQDLRVMQDRRAHDFVDRLPLAAPQWPPFKHGCVTRHAEIVRQIGLA